MLAIFKREVRAYYQSPIAYVFTAALLLFTAIFFVIINISPGVPQYANSSFGRYVLGLWVLHMILGVIIPILTMRLLSEERKAKTDQLLMTAPIRIIDIVLGKYLAALFVFLVSTVITIIFPAILFIFGKPPVAELVTAYIGFFLMGAAFIAISVFVSSLTDSQVIAAILGMACILGLFFVSFLGQVIAIEWLKNVIDWISLSNRSDDFTNGILSLDSILYYLSFIVFFVFMTHRVIEKRRWSEG